MRIDAFLQQSPMFAVNRAARRFESLTAQVLVADGLGFLEGLVNERCKTFVGEWGTPLTSCWERRLFAHTSSLTPGDDDEIRSCISGLT